MAIKNSIKLVALSALGVVATYGSAFAGYVTVDTANNTVSVSPQLATDVGTQLLSGVGQGIDLVFSFIVPLIGILIILGFLYAIYYLITKRFARK